MLSIAFPKCCAGKEHPEFEHRGERLFTYACNTLDVPKLVSEANLYFAKLVTLPIPDVK